MIYEFSLNVREVSILLYSRHPYDGVLQNLIIYSWLQWDHSHKAGWSGRSLLRQIRDICGI